MLAIMARGDECKTANKATYACKHFDVAAPIKKPAPAPTPSYSKQPEKAEPKSYGSWGPIFKDKKSFADMHHC